MKWNKFVAAMRGAGVTHLLHEEDTYEGTGLCPTMHVYAEDSERKLIAVYNPDTDEGRILSRPTLVWSRKGREFKKIKI